MHVGLHINDRNKNKKMQSYLSLTKFKSNFLRRETCIKLQKYYYVARISHEINKITYVC